MPRTCGIAPSDQGFRCSLVESLNIVLRELSRLIWGIFLTLRLTNQNCELWSVCHKHHNVKLSYMTWTSVILFNETYNKLNKNHSDHLKRAYPRTCAECAVISSCACAKYFSGFCSPYMYSVVTSNSVPTEWLRRLVWLVTVRVCPKTRFRLARPNI